MSDKMIEDVIASYLASFQTQKYLIIGASPHKIIMKLMKFSKQITVIDIRSEKLNKISSFIDGSVQCILVKESNEFLYFADNSFDFVVYYDVLHHFPDKNRVISETKRILRNNGYAFFAEPNISSKLLREYDQFGELKKSIYKRKFYSILKKHVFKIDIKTYSDFISTSRNGGAVRHYVRKYFQRSSIDPLFRIYFTVCLKNSQ